MKQNILTHTPEAQRPRCHLKFLYFQWIKIKIKPTGQELKPGIQRNNTVNPTILSLSKKAKDQLQARDLQPASQTWSTSCLCENSFIKT